MANIVKTVATVQVPFSCTAVVTGLTVGTSYWLDLSLAAVVTGTATITGVSVTVVELP